VTPVIVAPVVAAAVAAALCAAVVSAAEQQAEAEAEAEAEVRAEEDRVAMAALATAGPKGAAVMRTRASFKAQPPPVATCSVLTQAIFTVPRTALTPGSTLERLVDAVEDWRAAFVGQREEFGHSTFWHRTSNKVVLCVLALQIDGNLEFVRGCNLEVSLPTGSLCSERNAIGSALTRYPFLRREHFVGIAVLSLTEGATNLNPLPPCGVCASWIDKIHEVNQEFRVIMFSGVDLSQVHITTFSPLAAALCAIRDCGTDAIEDHRLTEAVQLTLNYNDGWQSPLRRR